VHPVPSPVIAPQCVDVSPMDQLQLDPGSIPEASTSDTNAATEGTATEGTATTGAAGAAGAAGVGMTIAEGVVTGVVAMDVVVVATGATTDVVVVVT
jgi:hypothetical protein